MRSIDVDEQARGAFFGVMGTAVAVAIVLLALLAVFASAGCAGGESPTTRAIKAMDAKKTKDDWAGIEAMKVRLTSAIEGGAPEKEVEGLRTQLAQARKANAQGEIEDAKHAAELAKVEGRSEARRDFYDSTKRWTGWAMVAMVGASVAVLVASIFIPTISRRGAIWGFAGAAAIGLVRYILLTYGIVTAEVAFWICIAGVALVGGFVGVPIVVAWVRSRIKKVGLGMVDEAKAEAAMQGPNDTEALNRKARAKQRVREATALLAISSDRINEKRKSVVTALQRTLDGEASMLNEHTLKSVGLKV